LEFAKLLLDRGADKDVVNEDGWTPLHFAAFKGYSEMMKLLLNSGANKDAATKSGLTPLDIARNEDQRAIVSLLEMVGGEAFQPL